MSKIDRASFKYLKVVKFLYESLYFHMFPYLIFLLILIKNLIIWSKVEQE